MSSSSSDSGIGLCGVMFIVFLVLKLCGVIQWSWWWVTGPLWIPAAFVLACLAIGFLIVLAVIGIVNLFS